MHRQFPATVSGRMLLCAFCSRFYQLNQHSCMQNYAEDGQWSETTVGTPHDVGHAIGAVTISAGSLGWRTRLLGQVSTPALERLLGIDQQEGIEAEHGDCLLLIHPAGESAPDFAPPEALLVKLAGGEWAGEPNRLSTRACSGKPASSAKPSIWKPKRLKSGLLASFHQLLLRRRGSSDPRDQGPLLAEPLPLHHGRSGRGFATPVLGCLWAPV